MKAIAIISISILLALSACKDADNEQVELYGTIREIGSTSYEYGTHLIENGDDFVAIKSDNIVLDFYIDQNVTVIGEKVPGYPINGGPDLVDVQQVIE